MSNTYIFLLYAPIMCVMYYLASWIWLWNKLVEKSRKKPSLPCERELPKHKDCERTNGVITHMYWNLMIYGIINLQNHMNFVRYLDVFTIHSGVSFPLIVLIRVRYLNSLQNPFTNQWLYFLVTLNRIY